MTPDETPPVPGLTPDQRAMLEWELQLTFPAEQVLREAEAMLRKVRGEGPDEDPGPN